MQGIRVTYILIQIRYIRNVPSWLCFRRFMEDPPFRLAPTLHLPNFLERLKRIQMKYWCCFYLLD